MSAATAVMAGTTRINRRAIALSVFYFVLAAVLILIFGSGIEPGTETKFTLNLGSAPAIALPTVVLPSTPVIYLMAGVAAFCGALQLTRAVGAKWAILLSVALIAFVFGFLTWTAAGKSMSLVGVLQTTLYRAVPITFAQAALGAEIEVKTLDGMEDLKVPAGTQTGTVFRIKGQGMPNLGQRGKGDLFVAVTLVTPKSLTKEQRKLLEQLAEIEDVDFSDESFIDKVRNIFG